jgi:hypothetical protein
VHPYLAEVHIRQERQRLAKAAERHAMIHSDRAHSRPSKGRENGARWFALLRLRWARRPGTKASSREVTRGRTTSLRTE